MSNLQQVTDLYTSDGLMINPVLTADPRSYFYDPIIARPHVKTACTVLVQPPAHHYAFYAVQRSHDLQAGDGRLQMRLSVVRETLNDGGR